jgi:hypothetical protein
VGKVERHYDIGDQQEDGRMAEVMEGRKWSGISTANVVIPAVGVAAVSMLLWLTEFHLPSSSVGWWVAGVCFTGMLSGHFVLLCVISWLDRGRSLPGRVWLAANVGAIIVTAGWFVYVSRVIHDPQEHSSTAALAWLTLPIVGGAAAVAAGVLAYVVQVLRGYLART